MVHFARQYRVPRAGLEPALPLGKGILSPLCLPIPPPGQPLGFIASVAIRLPTFYDEVNSIEKRVPIQVGLNL